MLTALDCIHVVAHLRITAQLYRDLDAQLPELGTTMRRLAESADKLAAMIQAGYSLEYATPSPIRKQLDFKSAMVLAEQLSKATPEIIQSAQELADTLVEIKPGRPIGSMDQGPRLFRE